MLVFVTDARNNIGHPTRRSGWINKKLKNGSAKKLKRYKNLIQVQLLDRVFNKNKTVDCEFRMGIDPGYQHVGFCIYKIYNRKITKLFSGELTTRTEEIKKLLQERKMYRQNRRRNRRKNVIRKYGKCKFRAPRWKNRRDKLDRNPTLRHLMSTHCNLLNKFINLVGLEQTKIHIEYCTFDIHKIINPKVHSFWYQLGPKYSYQNTKMYVKKRDKYTCQSCGSRDIVNLEVHHIIERNDGGTDKPDNLTTVCDECHDKIHAGKIKIKHTQKIFRDAGVLNSCMKKIFETLENVVPTQHTYGYITEVMRREQGLEKTHSLDASIIAMCDTHGYQEEFSDYEYEDLENELEFIQKRRHVRNHVKRIEDRKYYVNGSKKFVAKNRRRRTSQKDQSFEDFRKKNPKIQVFVKPGVRRSRISNTKVLFKPGDKIWYNNDISTCYGWASTQGKVGLLEYEQYVPKRYCQVIAKNSGIVCTN